MFENYQATPFDLETVEKGISFAERPELDVIFSDRRRLKNLLLVSFDSKKLYLWVKKNNKLQFFKVSHDLKLEDRFQWGWGAKLIPSEIGGFLPKEWQANDFDHPKVSGGLLTPFVELQKLKSAQKVGKIPVYTTYESYLATIVHEFGHVYYNSFKRWWFSDKEENISYLKSALWLLETGNRTDLHPLFIPSFDNTYLGELFAACVERVASQFFWPSHFANIKKSEIRRFRKLIPRESRKNLDKEDSVLRESPHDFASVFSTLVLEQYPKIWPEKLLQRWKI